MNPGEDAESASHDGFFDFWLTYETMLDHNCMFHDDIYHDVEQFLATRYGRRCFSVLDLGCGSARHFAAALHGRNLGRYVGYDLSAEALAHAKQNLALLSCPVELHAGDLFDGLKASTGEFDLIFASFALHHLASKDKAALFRTAATKLETRGIFLMIDTLREEGEEPAVYLDRYCAWVQDGWKGLSPQARDAFCDHIRRCDLPETVSALQTMAVAAGFAAPIEIDRFRWHRTLCFEKR